MKKSFDGSSIGASLILVIFIIICLLTFATLSMLSAKADNTLSVSASENIVEFYEAEATAQKKLQEIDNILLSIHQNTENAQEYYDAVTAHFSDETEIQMTREDDVLLRFATTVSEIEIISSQIKVTFPSDTAEGLYEIQRWQLVNISDWEIGTDATLWDGTF